MDEKITVEVTTAVASPCLSTFKSIGVILGRASGIGMLGVQGPRALPEKKLATISPTQLPSINMELSIVASTTVNMEPLPGNRAAT